MRSGNRSYAIGGTDVDPPPATEPPYFTRSMLEQLAATPVALAGEFSVVSLGTYRGELRRAVHHMKFRNARYIAARLGRLLGAATCTLQVDWRPDVVTWAPTTARRIRLRGHDQSAIIAAACARSMRVKCVRSLRRLDDYTQTGASRELRRRGPRFVVRVRAVHGRKVMLIDDVMTTGTTLSRARDALLAAGAHEVRCAVVAHVKARSR
jgi:ComF family protein